MTFHPLAPGSHPRHGAPHASDYAEIAPIYDTWCGRRRPEIAVYVDEALDRAGPVLELGVGTGQVSIPIAKAGIEIVGVDSSLEMLRIAQTKARREERSVADRLLLVHADIVELDRIGLKSGFGAVISPLNTMLHVAPVHRRRVLSLIYVLLRRGGSFLFDAFEPSPDLARSTEGRRSLMHPGIYETPQWDLGRQTLLLRIESGRRTSSLMHYWMTEPQWVAALKTAGFNPVEVTHAHELGLERGRTMYRCIKA